jgi:tetratricopeptide (TPR) repeat protein
VESSREHIRSILQCLDEGDYDRAANAVKLITEIPSGDELSLFLEGLVLLARNQRQEAAKQFSALLLLLNHKTEKSGVVETYAAVLTLALCSMASGSSMDIAKARELLLQSPEREMFDQLLSHPVIAYDPEYYELQVTLQIAFGVLRAIDQGSISLKGLVETNFARQVELTHGGQSAVATFDSLAGNEDGVSILVRLGNCAMIRTLSYERYLDAFGVLCSSADGDNRQKVIRHLRRMVRDVEPRRGNLRANIALYKALKPRLNELTFRHYVQSGKIQEGFAWLESEREGKGMDFLRTGADHPKVKEGVDESIEEQIPDPVLGFGYDDTHFVVQQEHFPFKRMVDALAVFRVVFPGGNTTRQVDQARRLMSYNVSLDTYLRLLDDPNQIDQRVREEIIQRICDNTKSIRRWALEEDGVEQIRFPFEVGQLYKARREFDDAIELFRNSDADVDQVLKAIDQCQYERASLNSKDLKENLKELRKADQKQPFPYSMIFKSEILLRDAVDKQMKVARDSATWLEGDRNPKLKEVKRECQVRKSGYESNVMNKGRARQSRLIDFSTLPELVTIIDVEWDELKSPFRDKQRVMALLVPLSNIRRDVAHSKLVDEKQVEMARSLCLELTKVLGTR